MKNRISCAVLLISCAGAYVCISTPAMSQAAPHSGGIVPAAETNAQGSTYIPMDSWLYPALTRLYGMGYLDTAFLGQRPWSRLSVARMLDNNADAIEASSDDEARELFLAIRKEIQPDIDQPTSLRHPDAVFESAYTELRGISGTPLRDSYHIGQSIVNDYGRPYESGFNGYGGFSGRAIGGRFSLYYRGEYQRAPGAAGYSPSLAAYLSNVTDSINFATSPNQATIPEGPIPTANNARLVEGYVAYELLNHEFSIGKEDHWLGPARGASMLWGNNAEDIYNFEINRVEPLKIPLLSRVTGPFRYQFFVGSLKGHTAPNDPWVHVEKVSLKPTSDLEFGFSRMVIWGGKGHEPVTLHTFLRSFFSFSAPDAAIKNSNQDPGARFGNFDFTWRLPYLQHWITLYSDSFVHDDVSPIDAPRRAALHPGIYLSRFPGLEKLDFRAEAASTDVGQAAQRQDNGQFFYWEVIQKQGPTNKGFLLGDWIGRTDKGGQGWLTWHFTPKDEIGFVYRRDKASQVFLPGGTTQNSYTVSVTKWINRTIQVEGRVQYEGWKAPLYLPGYQSDTESAVRITWWPHTRIQ